MKHERGVCVHARVCAPGMDTMDNYALSSAHSSLVLQVSTYIHYPYYMHALCVWCAATGIVYLDHAGTTLHSEQHLRE